MSAARTQQLTVRTAVAQRWHIELPPSGKEVFSPEPLITGDRLYRITFSGVYQYCYSQTLWQLISGEKMWFSADALYQQDTLGNLSCEYAGLTINGYGPKYIGSDWERERATHRYSCLLYGLGQHISFRLLPPKHTEETRGAITVRLQLLPPGAHTKADQAAHEKELAEQAAAARDRASRDEYQRQQQALVLHQQQEQERKAELLRQAALQAKERELERTVGELKRMVHINEHLFDKKFRDGYVRKHQQEIRQQLGQAWAADYEAVMGNRQLVEALQQQAPQVLKWHEARLSMYRQAEVLDVLPEPVTRPRKPVPLTVQAENTIRENLSDIYRVRESRDHLERTALAPANSQQLAHYDAGVAAGLRQLTRYGIVADSPERAEQQFQQLAANRPVKSAYEQIRDRILAGESSALDILAERLKDLFRHDCILVKQRRQAIRRKQWQQQYDADARLASSRAEIAQLLDLLRSRGFHVDLHQVEREVSREESVIGLMQEKQRVQSVFRDLGMDGEADSLDVYYANLLQQVLSPGPDEDSYA